MPDVLLSINHPVPVPWRARAGCRLAIKVRSARTEGRIERVPDGSFRDVDFPFMADRRDVTRAFEHDGRIWQKAFFHDISPQGAVRRWDIPIVTVLSVLSEGWWEGGSFLPRGTPLLPWDHSGPEGEIDGDDPVQASQLARCRAALLAYLRDDLRISDGALYMRIGLPCLSGVVAPRLCGAGIGWPSAGDMTLTRHDRVDAHVRFVGRLQADNEDARFRYFAELVAGVAAGIAQDEMGLGLFVNRLAQLTYETFEVHDRRWRVAGEERSLAMRRLGEAVTPLAALGLVGAIAPEDRADSVRLCLAALDQAELGKSARAMRSELKAYAEEVAMPALQPSGPEVDADLESLSTLRV